MSDLEHLEADRETAWREYNAAHRAIPDCEHVQAWRQRIADAGSKHQAAIRARDRAIREQEAPPAAEPMAAPAAIPAAPPAAPAPARQESLFELEGAV
jgi:hypothetical protein